MRHGAQRLGRELAEMKDNPPACCSASPVSNEDLYCWEASIYMSPYALPTTPWDGGLFCMRIRFPPEYPFSPPLVTLLTKVFHPNISPDGHVCLDILTNQGWTPALTLSKVLISILCLLNDPNPDVPLVREAADLYRNDRAKYDQTVREWVQKFAM